MQSENFDNKIRDSLSQRPLGNEKPEWDKMEKLLDKHLPVEKKDRRRIFLILFLFLLLGGGAFLIWKNNSGNKNDITEIQPKKENSQNNEINKINTNESNQIKTKEALKDLPQQANDETAAAPSKEFSAKDENKITDSKVSDDKTKQEITFDGTGQKITTSKIPNLPAEKKTPGKKQKTASERNNVNPKNAGANVKTSDSPNSITGIIKNDKEKTNETDVVKSLEENKSTEQKQLESETEDKKADQKLTDDKLSEPEKTNESQPNLTAKAKAQKQKTKSSFSDNLFFTVSAGPDFTSVGLSQAGRLKPVFGAGVGYQISKKFSIRTGFYTTRKVYTADPEDYYLPDNIAAYYPNLKHIDADCKVYEIPLTVDFTISQNKKQSWFASAGLSSLLMKKEVYDYYYKPNTSATYITYTRTIRDQNKHYFSVLNFSGGYTRTINKNFGLRAEPYAKFALGGIGYGKVKLNSGGILFSAIVKPFAKGKR